MRSFFKKASASMGYWGVAVIDLQENFLRNAMNDPEETGKLKAILHDGQQVLHWALVQSAHIYLIQFDGYGEIVPEFSNGLPNDWRSSVNLRRIKKFDNSAFTSVDFDETLKNDGVQTLIGIGVNTHACVYETIKGALQRNVNVVLPVAATANIYPSGLVSQSSCEELCQCGLFGCLPRSAGRLKIVEHSAAAIKLWKRQQKSLYAASQASIA